MSIHYQLIQFIFIFSWIVEGEERIPEIPGLLCENCFRSFCFKDGEKIGSLTYYPYPQPMKNFEVPGIPEVSEVLDEVLDDTSSVSA